MIRRPPRSTPKPSSAASDVYKRQSGHLCLSSHCNSLIGHQSVVDVQSVAHDPDSSHVAPARVVSGSADSSNRGTEKAAPLAEPPASTPQAGCPRSPGLPEASHLEVVQRVLRERGFSLSAAREMSSSVWTSSADVYQGKWAIFCGWCHQRGLSPVDASIQQIADFLIYLRREKLPLLSC